MAAPDSTRPRVLVTRPAHQADSLSRLIERAGATAVRFPTIEIAPPRDLAAFERLIDRLDEFEIAIFVSPNAVSQGLALIRARGRSLPPRLTIAAVGGGSARALADSGVANVTTPTRADSEGLLELAALREVRGKGILLFRGEGGREHLAQGLRERGARVEYAECYRRLRPRADTSALEREFMQDRIDVVTATSADALRNLFDMLGPLAAPRLAKMPLVVVSERLRDLAHELGHDGPVQVASAATDEAIVAAIATLTGTWRGAQKSL